MDSSNNVQFRINLGLNDTTNYTSFPCYGASALANINGGQMINCQLQATYTFSQTTPCVVKITDFAGKK